MCSYQLKYIQLQRHEMTPLINKQRGLQGRMNHHFQTITDTFCSSLEIHFLCNSLSTIQLNTGLLNFWSLLLLILIVKFSYTKQPPGVTLQKHINQCEIFLCSVYLPRPQKTLLIGWQLHSQPKHFLFYYYWPHSPGGHFVSSYTMLALGISKQTHS